MEAPYSEILGQLVADTFRFTDKYNVAVKQKADFIDLVQKAKDEIDQTDVTKFLELANLFYNPIIDEKFELESEIINDFLKDLSDAMETLNFSALKKLKQRTSSYFYKDKNGREMDKALDIIEYLMKKSEEEDSEVEIFSI